jgi:hypothetical protein
MINLQLTVREAMILATDSSLGRLTDNNALYEKIVTAFEVALGVNQRCTVTITRGLSTDNRIKCIKAIRVATGCGLKEAKDWTDEIMGGFNYTLNRYMMAKGTGSITLSSPERAEALLREFVEQGCEGYIS